MLSGADIVSPPRDWRFEIPRELVGSRLLANNGLLVLSGCIAPAVVARLSDEAASVRPESTRSLVEVSDGTEGRGGGPARAFRSASGGPVHWSLHASRELVDALGALCGVTLVATGGGTYSYYDQPGDHLALHRDVIACDVATITCLAGAEDFSSGGLLVYPSSLDKPLSQVRSEGRAAGMPVPLGRGDTAVLLGGVVPHEVTPMAGVERIVAVMCYRITSSDETST